MTNYPSISLSSSNQKEEIQQQREDEMLSTMLQKEPSSIEERQIDVTENTTEHSGTEEDDQYGCFVTISPVVSMNNLVINDDAMTGSTEIQLKHQATTQTNNVATTPPVSPVSSSPLASPTTTCQMKTGGGPSCQRRGRFLIWPVGPSPLGRSSSSHSK
jgi:hypothetical protein